MVEDRTKQLYNFMLKSLSSVRVHIEKLYIYIYNKFLRYENNELSVMCLASKNRLESLSKRC